MKTTKNTQRISFYDQADKTAELARLDALAATWDASSSRRSTIWARKARARRRKVSGWVVGTR